MLNTNFFRGYFENWRVSDIFAIIVVGGALFIDGVLLSVVVPIIPVFLNEMDQNNDVFEIHQTLYRELTPFEKKVQHDDLMNEVLPCGLILASKPIAQLFANMYVGPLADRVGHGRPFFAGFVIVFISTACLGYGISLTVLLVARIFQGIGSSFLTVVGLAMLASRYSDDEERGKAMTYALSGLTFGLIIGAPFAGLLYPFTGKPGPFLVICGFIALIAGLRLLMVDRVTLKDETKKDDIPSLTTLISDPYILLVASSIFFGNITDAFANAVIPFRMIDTMGSNTFELGIAFIPCDLAYLSGLKFYSVMVHYLGRWAVALIACILMGIFLLTIPLSKNLPQLIIPMVMLGVSNGMHQTSLFPELAHLMDIRHTAKYGNVYAIGDFAQCLTFGIVPIIAGFLMRYISFQWLSAGLAIICFAYSPLLLLLRNPPPVNDEENAPLMNK